MNTFRTASQPCATNAPEIGVPFTASCPSNIWACHPSKDQIEVSARQIWDSPDCLGLADEPPSTGVDQTTGIDITGTGCAISKSPLDEAVSEQCVAVPGPTPFSSTACQEVPLGTVPVTRFLSQPTTSSVCEGSERGATKRLQNLWDESLDVALSLEALCLERPRKRPRVLAGLPEEADGDREQGSPDVEGPLDVDVNIEAAEVVTEIVEAVAAGVDPLNECPNENDEPDVSLPSSQKTCRTQAVEADVAEEQTRLDKWMEPVPSRVDTEDDFTVFLSQQMAKTRISDLRTFPASQPVTAGYMNRVPIGKDRLSCLSGLALPTEENDLSSDLRDLSPASQPSNELVEEVCEDPAIVDPLSPPEQPVADGDTDKNHAPVGQGLPVHLEVTPSSQALANSAEICEDPANDDPLPPSETACPGLFATSPERDLFPERSLSPDRDLSPGRCSSQDSVREDPVSPRTASHLAEVVSAALAAQCADRAPDRPGGDAGPCLPPDDARSQSPPRDGPPALGRSDRAASEAEVEVDVEFEYSRADTVPCSPNGRPDFMTRTLGHRTYSSETASQPETIARPGPSGYAGKEADLSGYGSAESYSDPAPMEGEEGGPLDDGIDDGTAPASPAAAGPDTQEDPCDRVGQSTPPVSSASSGVSGEDGGRSASVNETPRSVSVRSERSERSALSGYIGRLVDGLEESAALPQLLRDGTAASNELWPDSGRSDSSHGNASDANEEPHPPVESPEPSQRTPLPSLSHAQRRELLQEIGLELVPDRGVVLHVTPAQSQEVEVAAAGSGRDGSPVAAVGTSRPAGTSQLAGSSGGDDGSNGGVGSGDGAAQSTQLGSAPVSPEVGFSACCLSPVVSLPAEVEEADADAEDYPPSLPSSPALGEPELAEQDSVGDRSRPGPDSCCDVLNEARLLSLTTGSSDDRSPAAVPADDGDGESREGVSSESQQVTGEQEDNAEEDEGIEESGGELDLSEAQIESEQQSQDGTAEESDCEITEYQSRCCRDAASQKHCEGAAGQSDCVVIEDQSDCVTADKRCPARRALVSCNVTSPAVETATCTPVGRKLTAAATQTSPPHGLPEGVLALRPASDYVLDLPAASTRDSASLQSAAVGTAAPSRCCPAADPEPTPTRVAVHSLVLRPASSADASHGDVPLGRSHSAAQDAVVTDSRRTSAGSSVRTDRAESPGSPARPCSAAREGRLPIAGATPASPSSPGGSAAVTGRSALDSPISSCATQPFRLSAALGPAGDGGWLSDGQEGRDGQRAQRGWSPNSPAAAAPAEGDEAEHHTPARSDSRSPATGPAVGGAATAAAAVARGPSPAATASSRSPPAAAGRCDSRSVQAPSVAALPSGGGSGGGGAVRPVTTGSATWSDGRPPASGPQWAAVPAAAEASRCGGLPDWTPAAGGGGSWEPRQPAEAAEPTAALGPSLTGGGPTSGADEPPEGARVPTAVVAPSGRPRTLRVGLSRRAQVTPLHRRPPY